LQGKLKVSLELQINPGKTIKPASRLSVSNSGSGVLLVEIAAAMNIFPSLGASFLKHLRHRSRLWIHKPVSPKGWHTLCRWCEPPLFKVADFSEISAEHFEPQ
jgi:hypothetical protein